MCTENDVIIFINNYERLLYAQLGYHLNNHLAIDK